MKQPGQNVNDWPAAAWMDEREAANDDDFPVVGPLLFEAAKVLSAVVAVAAALWFAPSILSLFH